MDTLFRDEKTGGLLDAMGLQTRLPEIGAPHCLDAEELAQRGYSVVEMVPPPALGDNQAYGEPELVQNGGRWKLFTPLVDIAEAPIEAVRAASAAAVDAAAESARLRFITPGAGQAMVYQQKAAEARAILAGGDGPFPHLQAEVGITAPSLAEVAAVVMAMENAWLAVSAAIEAKRLAGKRDIAQAQSQAEVDAILAAIEWPAP